MEFRPLNANNASRNGFYVIQGEKPKERNLLQNLEEPLKDDTSGVDCTLKLGFSNETPTSVQTPENHQSSMYATPQQDVRRNVSMMHGGGATLYGVLPTMAPPPPPPPPCHWPPQLPNITRFGHGVPLYPTPPVVPPDTSSSSLYSALTTFATQRYVGPIIQPAVIEEANYHRRCLACNTTSTPLWRNGPGGPKVAIALSGILTVSMAECFRKQSNHCSNVLRLCALVSFLIVKHPFESGL